MRKGHSFCIVYSNMHLLEAPGEMGMVPIGLAHHISAASWFTQAL